MISLEQLRIYARECIEHEERIPVQLATIRRASEDYPALDSTTRDHLLETVETIGALALQEVQRRAVALDELLMEEAPIKSTRLPPTHLFNGGTLDIIESVPARIFSTEHKYIHMTEYFTDVSKFTQCIHVLLLNPACDKEALLCHICDCYFSVNIEGAHREFLAVIEQLMSNPSIDLTKEDHRPLRKAIVNGSIYIVDLLLKSGRTMHPDALHIAVVSGDAPMVGRLLQNPRVDPCSEIEYAADQRMGKIAKRLLNSCRIRPGIYGNYLIEVTDEYVELLEKNVRVNNGYKSILKIQKTQ